MTETTESFSTKLTRLEDPFPLFRFLSVEDVAWITAFSADYRESRFFAEAFCKSAGHDSRLFRKAVSAGSSFGRMDPSYGSVVSASYYLLANTLGADQSRARMVVGENSLPSFSPPSLSSYGMRWLIVGREMKAGYPEEILNTAGSDRERLELFMDAPLGFVLTYKGIDNALCSFWPHEPDSVLIYQIQGVRRKKFRGQLVTGRHHSAGLNTIDFRKALVDLASSYARESGFSRIGIRGARNNIWTNTDDDGRPHIPMERASEVYDGTALRLGFSASRDGNWYRPL
ncbi:MAG: hypothetical protein U0R44_03010 [Candidatus Micrarchaeia archaeon]